MLDAIRKLLTRDEEAEAPTSTQIEDALEAAQVDLQKARARLAQVERDFADVLLESDDQKAIAHERKVAAAKREVARLELAIPRLGERLEGTRLDERRAAVEADVDDAIAARDEGLEIIEGLEEHWVAIIDAMERLEEIDRQIEQARRHKNDLLPGDWTTDLRSPNAIARERQRPLYDLVVLPPLTEGGRYWTRAMPSATKWNRPPQLGNLRSFTEPPRRVEIDREEYRAAEMTPAAAIQVKKDNR